MDPPLTSAAACLFRGLNARGEVFRLSWGRTSFDPLDRYTVGTAIKQHLKVETSVICNGIVITTD